MLPEKVGEVEELTGVRASRASLEKMSPVMWPARR